MTDKVIRLIATEAQEQRSLVQWIRLNPLIRDYLIKLNNEGKRTPVQATVLKHLGMCPGASDLFLAYPTKKYHGLWLEVKRKKHYCESERQTPIWIRQENFLNRMKTVGFAGEFCYGWEDGKRIIERYLDDTTQPVCMLSFP